MAQDSAGTSTSVYAAIQQPEPLQEQGNIAVNWREWKSAFDFFLIASGREKAPSKEKCAIFLHVIGKFGREILQEFELTDKSDFDGLVKVFTERLDPKRNVNFERHTFFETYQDDSFDKYLSDLKIKSKSCEFGTLKNSLILTQIIRGLKDGNMRERLLSKSSLDLDQAIAYCRAAERASVQAAACRSVKSDQTAPTLEELARGRGAPSGSGYGGFGMRTRGGGTRGRGGRGGFARAASSGRGVRRYAECDKCGGEHATYDICPAYNIRCFRCERVGHFAKTCREKLLREIAIDVINGEDSTDNDGEFFLDNVTIDAMNSSEPTWYENILVDNVSIKFKLDCGADATVMPLRCFTEAGFNTSKLRKTNTVLKEISQNRLPIVGYFMATMKHKICSTVQKVYVLDMECNTLLGRKACTDLQLIKRINELQIDDSIFDGIGCLPSVIKISIDETVPPVISASRRIPLCLKPRLKEELDEMVKLGIIKREEGPTDWVSPIVIVEKPDKKLRICIDPLHLNKAVRRSHFQLPTLDEVASELNGAKHFSKLDACKGFWMLKLDDASSKFYTFASPFGRYRFLRLPFGINCAPEIFHNEMVKIFKTEGVAVYIDDLIVFGRTKSEHDARLQKVFDNAMVNGVKFNKAKCVFDTKEVEYLGHVFSAEGMRLDPKRVQAIKDMSAPSNRKELERFLGVTNYLSRFISNYSNIAAPLRDLLKKDCEFAWSAEHNIIYEELKKRICTAPVLRYFSPDEEVTVSVDASSRGLGAVLLQDGRPVAYAARTLTPAESRWAQIEKELLAIVFGCTRFHQYIYGHNKVTVETDHKPLESIFKKPLSSTPVRLQRMLMKLHSYAFQTRYKPGKILYLADTLSRAPSELGSDKDVQSDVTIHVNNLMECLNVSKDRLSQIKEETKKDVILQRVKEYYLGGWPSTKKANDITGPFWTFQNEIHAIDGVLFRNHQIVIPKSLRNEILSIIHEGHLGIEKCKRRAKELVWWPGMGVDIEQVVQRCEPCQRHRAAQAREPLCPHPIPSLPWQVVAADLYEFQQKHFLLVVDYYSKFFEVASLNSLTSNTVINHMKNFFGRFGIPQKIVTDNGPQYSAQEFKQFAEHYGFEHVTSSPMYPRSNGLIERNVQTVKKLFIKAQEDHTDWQLALLNFRNTPISGEKYSPAQLLMGRRLRTRLPAADNSLRPETVNPTTIQKIREEKIIQVKEYYDRSTKRLPQLKPDEHVRMRDNNVWVPAKVAGVARGERSYWITTGNGRTYRRNRTQILQRKDGVLPLASTTPPVLTQRYSDLDFILPDSDEAPTPPLNSAGVPGSPQGECEAGGSGIVTRSGRLVRPPQRFSFD